MYASLRAIGGPGSKFIWTVLARETTRFHHALMVLDFEGCVEEEECPLALNARKRLGSHS